MGSSNPTQLPMKARHVRLVLDGKKTTTLRTKPVRGVRGLYIKGKLMAKVDIEPLREMALPVDLQQLDKLVASEGYPSDESGFRAAVCEVLNVRGHTTGTDFLTRARKLWLHRIIVQERYEEAQS